MGHLIVCKIWDNPQDPKTGSKGRIYWGLHESGEEGWSTDPNLAEVFKNRQQAIERLSSIDRNTIPPGCSTPIVVTKK